MNDIPIRVDPMVPPGHVEVHDEDGIRARRVLPCGKWCFGWKDTQLHCALPVGHEGAHRLSEADERLASKATTDFMRRAVAAQDRAR